MDDASYAMFLLRLSPFRLRLSILSSFSPFVSFVCPPCTLHEIARTSWWIKYYPQLIVSDTRHEAMVNLQDIWMIGFLVQLFCAMCRNLSCLSPTDSPHSVVFWVCAEFLKIYLAVSAAASSCAYIIRKFNTREFVTRELRHANRRIRTLVIKMMSFYIFSLLDIHIK